MKTPSISHPTTENTWSFRSRSWARRQWRSATSMLNLFSLRGLIWGSGTGEKVVVIAAEVESLRSEVDYLEDREAYLKAQLEHVHEILRSAQLSGYLYFRTRWTAALPGEPPPIDDIEVDDWIPCFLVLHGSGIFLYLLSTHLSPQDSTLLSDVTEVGSLPSLPREDGESRYCFYIVTRRGLRYACSSASKVQVDLWLTTLRVDCKLRPDRTALTESGSFARVAKEISEKFVTDCQSSHVENRLRTIKGMWKIISEIRCRKSGFGWDDSLKMITCNKRVYEEEVAAHPDHDQFLNKPIEMYDEMALVVGKDIATGNFAKSFDDIDDEMIVESASIGCGVSVDDVSKEKENPSQPRSHRKRRPEEDEAYNKLSDQIREVALAIKKLTEDRLNVNDLYEEVMKVEGFDELMLASAFDYLVENEKVAKGFMAKNARLKRAWLESFFKKCV